jgi:4-amino-4-deoxy-L-arabinose transferase-like glycosyltransferase
MPLHGCNPGPVWRWHLLAAVLILGSSALHLAYLTHDCPLDLAPDEAHYWDWSRHLDWSYYSKGPLVALLIRGSCELFGGWSESVCGSPMVAIRLPAVVCGALLLASLYVLTAQALRSEKLAAGVVALALTLPPVAAGASLMTIDSPYTACWGWALVAGHRAAVRGSPWAWPVAGLFVGIGILAKYTMALWLPSMALFLLAHPVAAGFSPRESLSRGLKPA